LTSEQLAAMATSGLRLDPPPLEADIDTLLARLAGAFAIDESVAEDARRLLHARLRIRMDMGQTLKSEDHLPWLGASRSTIDPFYWDRYRQMLLRDGWSPLVAATLDRSTDELLDLLGDPTRPGPWKRRGLVVGDVQSGKTASYAALICKAADAGYRMVILLTGTLENVRRQTQERLDAAFVGLDSRDFLTTSSIGRKSHIGVGLIDGRRDGIVFTSRDHDFRKNTASALNISLEAVREPVLVVSKKNTSVLRRLAGWLRARNADRDGRIDLPLLLVDDEADNASINTRQEPGEATAINKGIRDLLGVFTRSSYVGFTATPFANIFIDPASTHEMLGDDLFPRDFIHVLETPTNYVGMNTIFGGTDPELLDIGQNDLATSVLRTIEDEEDWLPSTHQNGAEVEDLPESLRTSLRCFLLATAIRDIRLADGVVGRGGNGHRSMLVNVSRFTVVQNRVADVLHLELEDIRRAVRLHGALPPAEAAEHSTEVAYLATIFDREFSTTNITWPRVLATLHEAVAPIVVRPINQSTGAASLDYTQHNSHSGLRVIAVGGNSLSRGLTLEGLSTSYFLRNAKAYDTLLQMGRWFGYRDGYRDLCRLWLTAEAEGWYRHVTDATAELKRDFSRMRRRQATPIEFGLRVRTHPDTLLITARNKMASGIEVVGETRGISLFGRGIESSRLYADERRNRENFARIDRFVEEAIATAGQPQASPFAGGLVWHNVPWEPVGSLVQDFLLHPLNYDFQGDSISEFLGDLAGKGDLSLVSWTVALLTEGNAGALALSSLPSVDLKAKMRGIKVNKTNNSLLVSGRGARVGSRRDVRHGLTAEQVEVVIEDFRQEHPDKRDVPEDKYREVMSAPLLLIYLIRGKESGAEGAAAGYYRNNLVLPALALHFPGVPDPDTPAHLVRYRLNRIAQDEFFAAEVDDEAVSDDPDADD
jgi:Z1 domain